MIEDCVIVGGGVAGLSAANRLADAGLSPLIVEASKYPAHRICGEFLHRTFAHEKDGIFPCQAKLSIVVSLEGFINLNSNFRCIQEVVRVLILIICF